MTKCLEEKGVEYQIRSSPALGKQWVDSGCYVHLSRQYILSIQTNPAVCMSAFAETGLFNKNDPSGNLVEDVTHGLDPVARLDTPEDFSAHIDALLASPYAV